MPRPCWTSIKARTGKLGDRLAAQLNATHAAYIHSRARGSLLRSLFAKVSNLCTERQKKFYSKVYPQAS